MKPSQAYNLAGGIISFSLAAVLIWLSIFWPKWIVEQVDFFVDFGGVIRVVLFFLGIVGAAYGYLALDDLVKDYIKEKEYAKQ